MVNLAIADGWAIKRGGNCKVWFKRFFVKLNSVSPTGFGNYLCKWNNVDRDYQWAYTQPICKTNPGFEHWAKVRANSGTQWVQTIPSQWWESAGKDAFRKGSPFQKMSFSEPKNDKTSPMEANVNSDESTIKKGEINIPNLQGTLCISKNDFENNHGAIVLSVFTQIDDNEEIEPNEETKKVLSSSKILLIDGKIYVSGVFNPKNISVSTGSDNLVFTFNFDASINFSRDFEEDDIYFSISADIGNKKSGEIKEDYLPGKEEKEVQISDFSNSSTLSNLMVNIIGNPLDGSFIRYTIKSSSNGDVVSKIHDLQGNIIYTLPTVDLKEDTEYDFIEKLHPRLEAGQYFLRTVQGSTINIKSILISE